MDAHIIVESFREVVFSVRDFQRTLTFYQQIAGWEIIYEGVVDPQQMVFWHVDPAVKANQALLREPHSKSGLLRLVKFHDVEQKVIRSSARTWDTGGIYDVNVRVHDIQAKFNQLLDAGWHGVTDPIEYTFSGLVVKEVLMRGHDDVVFALIERVHPPLQSGTEFREFSRIFNSSQIVSNIDVEVDFYARKLGFILAVRGKIDFEKDKPNVLGLPYNLAETSPDVAIISPHADGRVDGSMEFLTIPNANGTDFSDRAVPPNLGILMLRYPVNDIEAYYSRLQAQTVEIITPPTILEMPPYGHVKAMSIRTPNGAWLEFFEEIRG